MRFDELADAMGINVDHVRPSTSEDLKLKIAQIAKDPAMAKYLPKKFQGPNGAMYDKFGNAINEPKQTAHTAYNNQQQLSISAKLGGGPAAGGSVKARYTPYADQKLIQRIGIASNMNVMLSHAYGSQGRHHTLTCGKCGLHMHIYDDTMFVESGNELQERIAVFCKAHRHEEKPAEVLAVTGRRFREDD